MNIIGLLNLASSSIKNIDVYDEAQFIKLRSEEVEIQIGPEGEDFLVVMKKL